MAFTSVTIHYGPFRARAEPIRIALASQGVTWTEAKADWGPGMKSDTETYKFGQAPVVEFDGFRLVQSNAILRYVGRKLSFYGSNDEEAAEIDMYLDGIADAQAKVNQLGGDKYSDESVAKFLEAHVLPEGAAGRNGGFHLAMWDRFLKKPQGNGGFLVGGKLSIADIAAFTLFENFFVNTNWVSKGLTAKVQESFPSIQTYVDHIKSLPHIKAYVESETRYPPFA